MSDVEQMARFLRFLEDKGMYIGWRSNTWPVGNEVAVAQFLAAEEEQ